MEWFRQAYHSRLPLQVYQEATTSTEFYEWMYVYNEEEKKRKKWEYYLANLICEVHNFAQMFVKTPKFQDPDKFFVKFQEDKSKVEPEAVRQTSYYSEEETEQNGKTTEEPMEKPPSYSPGKKPSIVPGPDAVKHPGWAATDKKMKALFGRMLGIDIDAEKEKQRKKREEEEGKKE